MSKPSLVWFRQDLRLGDNPALEAARERGAPIHFLYVLDDADAGSHAVGAASRWWLHRSLEALSAGIGELGGSLTLMRGPAGECVPDFVERNGIGAVFWNRRYEPWAVNRDKALKASLSDRDIAVKSFAAAMIHEPWTVCTKAGGPFAVFTPFWRAMKEKGDPPQPLGRPRKLDAAKDAKGGCPLDELDLLPRKPNWAEPFEDIWTPGEDGARAQIDAFLSDAVNDYADGRDFPAKPLTSRLSPHLHFGEISPRQVWHWTLARIDEGTVKAGQGWAFLRELGWRDFNRHLLYHNPETVESNFKSSFDAFPWRDDDAEFEAWSRGNTGYPFVDAGMRELWQTGYMHNRVRMVTASFLVKHLLLDWRRGEAWFRDTLVDADLANNVGGWQWTAGCGADAAPYFRIFNPFTQGEKFDPKGEYVRKYVPEIAGLPDKWLHKPWEAPGDALKKAGVELGRTYPNPIVDHKKARERALEAYEAVKKQ